MWRFIKVIFILLILIGIGLVGYAYVGPMLFPADFAAPAQEVNRTVTFDTN